MNPRWHDDSPHGFVFDLDGTLTRPQHDFDAIRAALGIPRGRLILEFIAEQPDAVATRLRQRLDDIEDALAAKARPALGLVRLCEHLQARVAQRGDRLGILTRNSRANAFAALHAIGASQLFPSEFVLGREDATPKPDPAGIQRLLDSWALPATACTMIGDSHLDIDAGRAAGVYTVHVVPPARRRATASDLHLPSLAHFAQLLAPPASEPPPNRRRNQR